MRLGQTLFGGTTTGGNVLPADLAGYALCVANAHGNLLDPGNNKWEANCKAHALGYLQVLEELVVNNIRTYVVVKNIRTITVYKSPRLVTL